VHGDGRGAAVGDRVSAASKIRDAHVDMKAALQKLDMLRAELDMPDTNHTWSKARMFLMDAIDRAAAAADMIEKQVLTDFEAEELERCVEVAAGGEVNAEYRRHLSYAIDRVSPSRAARMWDDKAKLEAAISQPMNGPK
jgi:hypothetical protein